MARYLTSGHSYAYTNSGDSAISAGDVVVNGSLFGVAECPIAVGGNGTISLCGIYEIAKASGAISVGQAVYWDATNKNITTTASTNLLCGIAVKAAESSDSVATIVINHWKEQATASGSGSGSGSGE